MQSVNSLNLHPGYFLM